MKPRRKEPNDSGLGVLTILRPILLKIPFYPPKVCHDNYSLNDQLIRYCYYPYYHHFYHYCYYYNNNDNNGGDDDDDGDNSNIIDINAINDINNNANVN